MNNNNPTPIIIDIEASGFGRGSYPIEIGLALADGQTFCQLVQPAPEWSHWDPQSAQLHNIDRRLLVEFGHPVEEIASHLNQLLQGQVVYSDGWGFDQSWLNLLFHQAGMLPRFRIEALTHILSQAQQDLWDRQKQRLTEELGLRRHRASNDAKILQLTYLNTKNLTELSTETAALR